MAITGKIRVVNDSNLYLNIAKILTYSSLSFLIGLWWGPYLIRLLIWLKFWKKKHRLVSTTGEALVVTKKFYEENEKSRLVPRGGGILIWLTTFMFAVFFWILLKIDPENKMIQFLNFTSRRQTFIPLATMFFGATLGLIDDALATLEDGGNYFAGGLKLRQRIMFVGIISFLIGLWFYFKIGITSLAFLAWRIDFIQLNLPWLIIPITVILLVGLFATSVIDGLDGLFVGVFIPIYLAFAGLAFVRGFSDIATMLMVIVGTMFAYMWYNISPAKFFMGDTGSLALVLTLGVVAILIDAVWLVPIIAIMPVLTAGSNVVQILSKKFLKKKVLHAAPLHHHLQAIGWTNDQIVIRYWVITILSSFVGTALGLIFR
jgi:phospho-N-acetylmuramoyl-pentapeptide-transferase